MKLTRHTNKLDDLFRVNMREFRRHKNITIKAMAIKLGVSDNQVLKYEKGLSRVTIGRAFEIAEALEVDINQMFFDRS